MNKSDYDSGILALSIHFFAISNKDIDFHYAVYKSNLVRVSDNNASIILITKYMQFSSTRIYKESFINYFKRQLSIRAP